MIGFITTATHKRIVAEKDAEIAGLMKRLSKASADLIAEEMVADDRLNQIRRLHSKLRIAEKHYTDQDARLAVFTAPRQRGPRGRFLSTKEQVA